MATLRLDDFRGQTIFLQFEFDSGDRLANNFEGWYLDDVRVRTTPMTLSIGDADYTFTGSQAHEGLGASVAGIGEYDGTWGTDLAVLSSGRADAIEPVSGKAAVYRGGVTPNLAATFTRGEPLIGYTLAGAGPVDGDELDELVLSSNVADSYLIFGGSPIAALDSLVAQGHALQLTGPGGLIPLGDIDGDGQADLGHVAEATTDRVTENGDQLKHLVGQVFLGSCYLHNDTGLADLFDAPDLQVETGRPFFSATLNIPNYFFGPLGNVNADLRTDVAPGVNTSDASDRQQGPNVLLDGDVNATGVKAMFSLPPSSAIATPAQKQSGPPPDFGWALGAGDVYDDSGRSVATDAAGNVYVTGYFSGEVDFDPGPGTANVTSTGGQDVFVAKYSSPGSLVWVRGFGGTEADQAFGIAVDGGGSVYTTGYFYGTADFDPGAGTASLTSAGEYDVFVSKLDSAGNYLWARQVGGSGGDTARAIAVDGAASVYTVGYFQGTADFDPGAGTGNLTSAGQEDMFVSKLDSAGNYVWARQLGGSSDDRGYGIAVDRGGNVYTTGWFYGTADFDPSLGTATFVSFGEYDVFVSKLDSAGNYVWARQLGGGSGNVGYGIAVDGGGSVYTTGYFNGTADFDPGSGTANLATPSGEDVFVSKLDSAGNYVWARQLGGSSDDWGYGIAVDGGGNVYATGLFQGTADFDPGPIIANLTSGGDRDVFLNKLDSDGNYVWARQLGRSGYDIGYGIAVDGGGNVYSTGCFSGTGDFDPGPGTFNLTSAGGGDIFVSKLTQSVIGDRVWHDQDSDGIQDAGEPGRSGVTVSVYDQPSGGTPLQTTTSGSNGQYSFVGLGPGTYYVEVTLPSGFVLSPNDQGADDTVDSDFDRTTRRTGPIALLADQDVFSVDAGVYEAVTIEGRKFNDLNGDGVDVATRVVVIELDSAAGADTFVSRGGQGTESRAYNNHGGQTVFVIGMTGDGGQIERTLIRFDALPSLGSNVWPGSRDHRLGESTTVCPSPVRVPR
jgi:hypothetical protein